MQLHPVIGVSEHTQTQTPESSAKLFGRLQIRNDEKGKRDECVYMRNKPEPASVPIRVSLRELDQ